jgi:hypothetical protein
MLTLVNSDGSAENGSLIDEIVREGARRMVAVVRAGVRFERGILVEREEVTAA